MPLKGRIVTTTTHFLEPNMRTSRPTEADFDPPEVGPSQVAIRPKTGEFSCTWKRDVTGELTVGDPTITGSLESLRDLGVHRDAFLARARRLCADAARKAGQPRYP
jgi:hypothetical protein